MEKVRNWKLKKVIGTINKIADAKLEQVVLLKELAHSVQAHQKDKTAEEWKKDIFGALNKMLEKEKEILGDGDQEN